MKNSNRSGFTLIELLVVVAIIGVLASVVLASLNTARTKGSNASVKANMANLRAAAEMLYDTYGCYTSTDTCSASSPIVIASGACSVANAVSPSLFANAAFYSGITTATTAGGGTYNACSSTVAGTAWAVAVIQKGATAAAADSGWCVDSTGKSKSITVATLDQLGITAETSGGACVE